MSLPVGQISYIPQTVRPDCKATQIPVLVIENLLLYLLSLSFGSLNVLIDLLVFYIVSPEQQWPFFKEQK